MITEEIKKAIKKRMATNNVWDDAVNLCWKEEIEILSRNIDDTIAYLENDCTGEEFVWLSEVIDDVVEKTQSRPFVDCLFRVAKKFPEECKNYSIYYVLEICEGVLNE